MAFTLGEKIFPVRPSNNLGSVWWFEVHEISTNKTINIEHNSFQSSEETWHPWSEHRSSSRRTKLRSSFVCCWFWSSYHQGRKLDHNRPRGYQRTNNKTASIEEKCKRRPERSPSDSNGEVRTRTYLPPKEGATISNEHLQEQKTQEKEEIEMI